MNMPKYKRVLLKLSGEALKNSSEDIIDYEVAQKIALQIKKCIDDGTSFGIVIGGGNIFRGAGKKIERTSADKMGMLATLMNSLAFQSVLEDVGVKTVVMTSLAMPQVADPFNALKAREALDEGKAVIIAGGTGNPYFSTDTASVLRALEIEADAALFAKNVDGVYTADPRKDPNAKKLDEVTYSEILKNDLAVIDLTASAMGKVNGVPVIIFALNEEDSIYRVINGEKMGTVVKN
ncbi:MAG: UMP kinase [Clostridiales bacterium]|nr:UMP kinase [Clostridiales bacterium]